MDNFDCSFRVFNLWCSLGVVSKDLKEFIQSDTDEIPNSLRQLSKITRSDEVSESIANVTRALTLGILRGYRVRGRKGDPDNSFPDRALDKLLSPAGSGFISVVVGSFTKNMVLAVYTGRDVNESNGSTSSGSQVQNWVDIIAEEKCKKLIGDCIQQFVSTLVTVYLDKTMDVNPYDQILSGLTNPKHEEKARNLLSSFCNGAIETLVRSSHQVISNSNGKELILNGGIKSRARSNGFVSTISSTLAVPSNRSLVLDVTGRVTFATVRSFLDFFLEQLSIGMKRKVDVVHEEAIDKGREVYSPLAWESKGFCLLGGAQGATPPSFGLGLRITFNRWELMIRRNGFMNNKLDSSKKYACMQTVLSRNCL
ncbi:hypothetical protein E3N88_05040 [Mikania micrantha]|uniref:Protein PHLOEM PROTEIN 2-LIKE A10 n=1 Tax=Mikania micrantha TaxID=192012 RepID=A0A5N6PWM9_9ASTR|nr:hypothetical protein E3N88_05040 [Mikania micrantha]